MSTSMSDPLNDLRLADEVDLAQFAHFVGRHWKVLAVGAIAGLLVAVALASARPRLFQAKANLMLVSGERLPVGLTVATAKALLVSPEIASATLNELGLNRDGMTVRRFIEEAVDVQLTSGINVITISVALPDPARARAAVELLATKVVDARRRIEQKAGVDAVTPTSPLENAERSLQEAANRLADFQADAELERLETDLRSSSDRRARVADLTIRLDSERSRLASLEEELARHPSETDRRSADRPRDDKNSSDGNLEQGDRFPSIRTMLEHDVAQSRATIATLRTERERTIAALSEPAAAERSARLHQLRVELARLRSEYEARSRAYNLALSSYVQLGPNLATARLRLVSPPLLPDEPIPLHRIRYGLLGGVIGLGFSVLAALIVDRRNFRRAVA